MVSSKPKLNIGLIGTGFMGKAHVFGFAAAQRVFDLPHELVLHTVADRTDELAAHAASTLGFARSSGNWRSLVDDPEIDLIDITAPNAFHKDMALAAVAAGKHVYCEKPLAPLAAHALEMVEAAEAAGVKTQVGFNYLCNPMFALARDMIANGELGEIRSYRGVHAEDYMMDAESPFTFRHDTEGGGALADLGSHALATAEFLLGPIERVMGDCVTAIGSRPDGQGGRRAVEVDDIGRAFLRFANGASGSIEASWVATFIAAGTALGAAVSAVSRRAPITIPMACSASRPGTSSASTISSPSRSRAMSKRLPASGRNHSVSVLACAFKGLSR